MVSKALGVKQLPAGEFRRGRGGQPGNLSGLKIGNYANNKPFFRELQRQLRANPNLLPNIMKKFLSEAEAGKEWAIKELRNMLDGIPVQQHAGVFEIAPPGANDSIQSRLAALIMNSIERQAEDVPLPEDAVEIAGTATEIVGERQQPAGSAPDAGDASATPASASEDDSRGESGSGGPDREVGARPSGGGDGEDAPWLSESSVADPRVR